MICFHFTSTYAYENIQICISLWSFGVCLSLLARCLSGCACCRLIGSVTQTCSRCGCIATWPQKYTIPLTLFYAGQVASYSGQNKNTKHMHIETHKGALAHINPLALSWLYRRVSKDGYSDIIYCFTAFNNHFLLLSPISHLVWAWAMNNIKKYTSSAFDSCAGDFRNVS